MRARAVTSLSGGFTKLRVTKSFEWERTTGGSGPTGGLWSHLFLGAGRCQLLTGCWAKGSIRITSSGCSHFFLSLPATSFPLSPKARKAKRRKHASLCHAAPLTRLPDILGEVLGDASHHTAWLGSFSSSAVPLGAFGPSGCAERGAASGWPLPNLAALPRAGLTPQALFPARSDQTVPSGSASSAFNRGHLRTVFRSRLLSERNTGKFGFSSFP